MLAVVAGIETAGLEVAAVTAGIVVGAGANGALDETPGVLVTAGASSSSCGFSSSEISTLAEGITADFCTAIICAFSQHVLLFAFPCKTARSGETHTRGKSLSPLNEEKGV